MRETKLHYCLEPDDKLILMIVKDYRTNKLKAFKPKNEKRKRNTKSR